MHSNKNTLSYSEHKTMHPAWGWGLFSNLEIPRATVLRKNIFVFAQNMSDGRGDYQHAKNFCIWLRNKLSPYGYAIGLLLQTDYECTNSEKNIIQSVINDLKKTAHTFCDTYWIYRSATIAEREEKIFDWLARKKYDNLLPFIQESASAIMVSFVLTPPIDCFIFAAIQKANVPLVNCYQYGAESNPTVNNTWLFKKKKAELSMGLPISKDNVSAGIEIYHQHRCYTIPDRIFLISKTNKKYIKNLLNSNSVISTEIIDQYQATHYFMPGYLQSESAALLFVLSCIYAIRKSGSKRICDFFLPPLTIRPEILVEQLSNLGLITHKDQIQFFGDEQQWVPTHKTAYIRIFQLRIEADFDYYLNFSLANYAVACSGDNTTSMAFSIGCLPFCQYKRGTIGDNFYRQQVLGFVIKCKDELDLSHPLYEGMIKLIMYIQRMAYLPDLEGKTLKNNEYARIATDLGNLMMLTSVQKAWSYVSDIIVSQYDIYNSLENVIRYQTNYSIQPKNVWNALAMSAEIQFLLEHHWLDRHDFYAMDLVSLEQLTKPNFIEQLPLTNKPYVCSLIYQLVKPKELIVRIQEFHQLIKNKIVSKKQLTCPWLNILYYLDIVSLNQVYARPRENDAIFKPIYLWSSQTSASARKSLLKRLIELKKSSPQNSWQRLTEHISNYFKHVSQKNLRLSNKVAYILYYLLDGGLSGEPFKKLLADIAKMQSIAQARMAGLYVAPRYLNKAHDSTLDGVCYRK